MINDSDRFPVDIGNGRKCRSSSVLFGGRICMNCDNVCVWVIINTVTELRIAGYIEEMYNIVDIQRVHWFLPGRELRPSVDYTQLSSSNVVIEASQYIMFFQPSTNSYLTLSYLSNIINNLMKNE